MLSLRRENAALREEVFSLKQENAVLRENCERLENENTLLRDDNERMKGILGNDSSNSSLPPSKDQPGKAPNTYNSRKPSKKKKGVQPGHPGTGLSKAEVEKKIQDGVLGHRVEEVGCPGRAYITRYRLDLEVNTIATEIRIYADGNGKFQVPDEYRAEVSYGTYGISVQKKVCFNPQKMAGGFRTAEGCGMYSQIMSVIDFPKYYKPYE